MPTLNIPDDVLAQIRAADPDFDAFMAGGVVAKDATVSDVHTASASGDKRRKKPGLTFEEAISPPVAKTFADVLEEANDMPLHKGSAPRALKPHPDGGAHTPFPHDHNALGAIPPEQTRRFLGALTDPDSLEQRRVPMSSLVAVQPRISPEKVEQMRTNGFDKLPTVVRHGGRNLLVDGNHRAAAQWLDGDSQLDCKFCALRGEDDSLAKDFGFHIIRKDDSGVDWEFNFEIKKADEDQQLIFGWASIVQEGDHLVVDHQNDMILPEDLEKGAYSFVLDARHHGDTHELIGTGRLVESMMFTKEKQDALGVVIKNDSGKQIVGWWVGFKVDAPDTWAKHRSGHFTEFSIGGHSSSIELSDLMSGS